MLREPTSAGCTCAANVNLTEGTAEIPDYGFSNSPYSSEQYKRGKVVYSFERGVRCGVLKTIHVPSTVTSIGALAFYQSTVEVMTFQPGSKLTKVGRDAFNGATKLQRLVLPEGVITIDTSAFDSASATELVLPASLAKLGTVVFNRADVDTIIFLGPSQLAAIPSETFYYSTVRVLRLPRSVKTIGRSGLAGCRELEELWIPISLAHKDVLDPYSNTNSNTKLRNITLLATPGVGCSVVRASAFEGMRQLKSVQLPAGVASIGPDAFKGTWIRKTPNAEMSSCTTIDGQSFTCTRRHCCACCGGGAGCTGHYLYTNNWGGASGCHRSYDCRAEAKAFNAATMTTMTTTTTTTTTKTTTKTTTTTTTTTRTLTTTTTTTSATTTMTVTTTPSRTTTTTDMTTIPTTIAATTIPKTTPPTTASASSKPVAATADGGPAAATQSSGGDGSGSGSGSATIIIACVACVLALAVCVTTAVVLRKKRAAAAGRRGEQGGGGRAHGPTVDNPTFERPPANASGTDYLASDEFQTALYDLGVVPGADPLATERKRSRAESMAASGNAQPPVYATPDNGDVDYSDYNEVQGSAGSSNAAAGEYKMLHPAHVTSDVVYEGQEVLGRRRTDTVYDSAEGVAPRTDRATKDAALAHYFDPETILCNNAGGGRAQLTQSTAGLGRRGSTYIGFGQDDEGEGGSSSV